MPSHAVEQLARRRRTREAADADDAHPAAQLVDGRPAAVPVDGRFTFIIKLHIRIIVSMELQGVLAVVVQVPSSFAG